MNIYPSVSIITISHNEEKNIRDCLDSLVSLEYSQSLYEIIVVDSSQDSTKEIVSGYKKVRLFESKHKEFSPKRNLGIKEARNEIIAFIDADCIVPSDWLQKMLQKISVRDVAAVASNAYPPPDSPFFGKLVACLGRPVGGAIGFDSYFRKLDRGISVVSTANTLFKKSALLEVGAFDEDSRFSAGGEDFDVSQKLLAAGYILEYQSDAFVYHKTRDLKNFLKWSFRQGVAQNLHYQSDKKLLFLLFGPSSAIWLLLSLISIIVLPAWIYQPMFVIIILLFTFMVAIKYKNSSNQKKMKLLIKRRKRIKVSLFSIFFMVIPLFYLDKLVGNLGHLHSKFWAEASKKIT
jgi:cellulose synthase/poly-beta-1,6-N-acetylglucosamine synthase-like glycosyltransferase